MFFPDRFNYPKQEYCDKQDCRIASKEVSQKKWLEKNPDYFKGQINADRVRKWRKTHPGYSREITKTNSKKTPEPSPGPPPTVHSNHGKSDDVETSCPASTVHSNHGKYDDVESSRPAMPKDSAQTTADTVSSLKALQDFAFLQPIDIKELNSMKDVARSLVALQDFAISQAFVFQGFAAHIYGDLNETLQDFATPFYSQCYDRGKIVLDSLKNS